MYSIVDVRVSEWRTPVEDVSFGNNISSRSSPPPRSEDDVEADDEQARRMKDGWSQLFAGNDRDREAYAAINRLSDEVEAFQRILSMSNIIDDYDSSTRQ